MTTYVAESERLGLQPLSLADHLEDYHAITSDELSMKWSSRTPSIELDDTKAMIHARVPSPEKPWLENYAIMLKPASEASTTKPKMIGIVGTPRHCPRGAELGYGLASPYWGQGYASEAMRMFISVYWAPDRHDSRDALIADIDTQNVGSERVVEKAGFVKEDVSSETYRTAMDIRDGVHVERRRGRWTLARPREV